MSDSTVHACELDQLAGSKWALETLEGLASNGYVETYYSERQSWRTAVDLLVESLLEYTENGGSGRIIAVQRVSGVRLFAWREDVGQLSTLCSLLPGDIIAANVLVSHATGVARG